MPFVYLNKYNKSFCNNMYYTSVTVNILNKHWMHNISLSKKKNVYRVYLKYVLTLTSRRTRQFMKLFSITIWKIRKINLSPLTEKLDGCQILGLLIFSIARYFI
jgi:hypothetical protein